MKNHLRTHIYVLLSTTFLISCTIKNRERSDVSISELPEIRRPSKTTITVDYELPFLSGGNAVEESVISTVPVASKAPVVRSKIIKSAQRHVGDSPELNVSLKGYVRACETEQELLAMDLPDNLMFLGEGDSVPALGRLKIHGDTVCIGKQKFIKE